MNHPAKPTGRDRIGSRENDESVKGAADYQPESLGPPLKDPRSQSAIDNIGVDDQADLLDVALDEQPGDLDASGRSFLDDVRSDGNDDEDNENR